MKIYLMRHGETDYNKRRCFYGSHDVSINDKGREQGKTLERLLQPIKIDKIYTSQLKRTQETARLAFPNRPFQTNAQWNEKDFGLWEGLTADDIQSAFPDVWQAWLDAPFEVTPPEAEPFSDFQNRVWRAVDSLIDDESEAIALVAHLGVLRLIYQKLIDPNAVFWEVDFPQGTVTCFEQLETSWRFHLLNQEEGLDDSHN